MFDKLGNCLPGKWHQLSNAHSNCQKYMAVSMCSEYHASIITYFFNLQYLMTWLQESARDSYYQLYYQVVYRHIAAHLPRKQTSLVMRQERKGQLL